MRLVTLEIAGRPRACAEVDGGYVDLNRTDPGLPVSVRHLLALGPTGLDRARAAAGRPTAARVAGPVRLRPPVPDPRKILGIGLNYRQHAIESHAPIPAYPVVFAKFPTALIGPGDPIVIPAISQEVDFEAELVIVIGQGGRHIPRARAYDAIAGYTIGHDVSARDWQIRKELGGGQWVLGKTFDSFAPLGPALVTRDEVPDPGKLGIRLRVNGRLMQNMTTADPAADDYDEMIFPCDRLVEFLSAAITLEPGDLIFTGTPRGVGFARTPPVFLQPGDRVEAEIDRLGVLQNPVVAEAEGAGTGRSR